MQNLSFYRLKNPSEKFALIHADVSASYSQLDGTEQDITLFYDAGDWLIINEQQKIIKNLGSQIEKWVENFTAFYIAASSDMNDFLEQYSMGSSFYAFTSTLSGEAILTRYRFNDDKEQAWEILFDLKEDETQNILQYCDTQTIAKNFIAEGQVEQIYLDTIIKFEDGQTLTSRPFYPNTPDETNYWEIEKRFPCACHTHEMSVYGDNSLSLLEFGYWQYGRGEQPWSWKTRIITIMKILMHGNPYSDMVTLDKQNVEALRDTLNNFLNKTK